MHSPGPRWDPKQSSLHQVLISIQGLILGVKHPYYLEPGHGGWEDTIKNDKFQVSTHTFNGHSVHHEAGLPQNVILSEDEMRVGTVKFAMIQPLGWALDNKHPLDLPKNSLESFREIIQAHFCENRTSVLAEVRDWSSDLATGRNRKEALQCRRPGQGGKKTLKIDELKDSLPKLEELLSKVTMPQHDEKTGELIRSSGMEMSPTKRRKMQDDASNN